MPSDSPAHSASDINTPPPPEVIVVRTRRVACDGVGGALGHPRVWLEMGEADFVECG
ncbi:MAG: zinc-finger domain-containing protein, partial [Caulobacterales bacterium]